MDENREFYGVENYFKVDFNQWNSQRDNGVLFIRFLLFVKKKIAFISLK